MWGKWNFSTCSGSKLRPEDGPFMVRVSVMAPESYMPRVYTGEIKVVNQNDKSDYCTIKVRLVIPKKKVSKGADMGDSHQLANYWKYPEEIVQ